MLAPLRAAFRTARDSLSDAVRVTPGWLLLCSVLVLIQAVLPGLQVMLLQQLIDSLAWGPLLGLTVVVGSTYPLAQVANAAGQRMMLRLRLHYRVELAQAAARLSPSRLADPDVVTDLEAGQAATDPLGNVASKPVQVLGAGVTSVVLCAAIWSINPLSGLLVLAALVPTVFAFSLISRMESKGWPKVARHERRAAYATEQLIQQRSGTELAVLGSGARVAAVAAELPLDTQLGQQWGGTGISGGQWQRLALARILLRNAGVWILDEPTSAIDAEAEREIFAELRRTKDTRITIVVSHRAWTLRAMDRIYVIDAGSVLQCGTYQELMSQPDGRFARLFAERAVT